MVFSAIVNVKILSNASHNFVVLASRLLFSNRTDICKPVLTMNEAPEIKPVAKRNAFTQEQIKELSRKMSKLHCFVAIEGLKEYFRMSFI